MDHGGPGCQDFKSPFLKGDTLDLQELIDAVFAQIEQDEPSLAITLAAVNGIIDEIGLPLIEAELTKLGITSTTTPQALVDAVFLIVEQELAKNYFTNFLTPFMVAADAAIAAALTKLTALPKGFKSFK